MRPFDRFVLVDWSARSTPSPVTPSPDAIWIAEAEADGAAESRYFRTRRAAMADLRHRLTDWCEAGLRVFLGVDFPLGYPGGFAGPVAGARDALAVWDLLAARISDGPDNANNRFDVARSLNALFPGTGPFWGGPDSETGPDLPAKGRARHGHGLPERRLCEEQVPRAQSCWKLYTTGSVGSQALLGLPHLAALRHGFDWNLAVWPFEPAAESPILIAEIYPGLIDAAVSAAQTGAIKDDLQVRLLAEALARLQRRGELPALFAAAPDLPQIREEGWILGAGAETLLQKAAGDTDLSGPIAGRAPPVSNDCFALPAGEHWTPVTEALEALRQGLRVAVPAAPGWQHPRPGAVLAADARARRSHPPAANAAVDGYGFAASGLNGPGPYELPLVAGRAAAGAPLAGAVPEGHAVRILTGAMLPPGVDTVVMQEDTVATDDTVGFRGPVKPGANARAAGEDVLKEAVILPEGRVLTVADMALLAATGVRRVRLRRSLRVGVLSTGDEIVSSAGSHGAERTYDANRPMLLSLAAAWGYAPIDLGQVGDNRDRLRARLDAAAREADVIISSGGASAGDEDHVSALLQAEGHLQTWRVAMKPGRPLAMGLWHGVPFFGLPGNPVAAFVCALIFARPALSVLAGSGWIAPEGFDLPAGFAKRKKAGRREYLRARIGADGRAEIFASEGSGRVSGLSWATGLVELDEPAREIAPGDPVRFLPFGSFGL